MRGTAGLVGVVEAAYSLDGDEPAWLRELALAGRACLPEGLSTVAYTGSVGPGWRLEPLAVASIGDPSHEALCLAVVPQLQPPDMRRAFARHYASCSETFAEPLPDVSRKAGVEDFLSVMAMDADGSTAVIGVTLGRAERTRAPDRRLWRRVSAHLSAGLRLRRRVARLAGVREAVFTANGRCHDAVGGAEPAPIREMLRAAVRWRERARGPLRRRDPDEALDLWECLVRSTWTLVDEIESDGRRHVVAFRNELPRAVVVGLSPRELEVVQLTALGRTNKEIAYTLGSSESSVAHRLHAAIRKLRLRTSTDVVRLYHHLRGAPVELVDDGIAVASVESGSRSATEFTAAEREVLALIARGMSNAGVARARGTAQRTVANQIAALLRKTGCGSRRELVARFAPSPSRS